MLCKPFQPSSSELIGIWLKTPPKHKERAKDLYTEVRFQREALILNRKIEEGKMYGRERPCRESVQREVRDIINEIRKLGKRIEGIRGTMYRIRGEKASIDAQIEEATKSLSRLESEFASALKERNRTKHELNAVEGEVKTIMEKLSLGNEEQVDNEIRRIEKILSQTTMSIKEERAWVMRIGTLEKSRVAVRGSASLREKLSSYDISRGDLVSKIKEENNKLDAINKKRGEVRTSINSLRGTERKCRINIRDLARERDWTLGRISELENGIEVLWEDYRTSLAEWRRLQEEKRQRKQGIIGRRDGEDIASLCGQLVVYLEKLMPPPKRQSSKESGKKLTLALEVHNSFHRLGIKAPANAGEIQKTLCELRDKMSLLS